MKAQAREACTCVSVCMYTFTQANTTCLFACIHSHKVIPHALHTHMYRVTSKSLGEGGVDLFLLLSQITLLDICRSVLQLGNEFELHGNKNMVYAAIQIAFRFHHAYIDVCDSTGKPACL